jgi:hypothetical protein
VSQEIFHAKCVRLTFQDGKAFLCVGPGDHTVIRYAMTWDQVRGLVLDAMPELLKR